jgi:putative FmdB family regulatory protein
MYPGANGLRSNPSEEAVALTRAMPIYEYACTCGRQFEELIVRRSDEAEVKCPACGSADVERRTSRTAPGRPAGGGPLPPRGCGPVG